jgi:hypothetical protein
MSRAVVNRLILGEYHRALPAGSVSGGGGWLLSRSGRLRMLDLGDHFQLWGNFLTEDIDVAVFVCDAARAGPEHVGQMEERVREFLAADAFPAGMVVAEAALEAADPAESSHTWSSEARLRDWRALSERVGLVVRLNCVSGGGFDVLLHTLQGAQGHGA